MSHFVTTYDLELINLDQVMVIENLGSCDHEQTGELVYRTKLTFTDGSERVVMFNDPVQMLTEDEFEGYAFARGGFDEEEVEEEAERAYAAAQVPAAPSPRRPEVRKPVLTLVRSDDD